MSITRVQVVSIPVADQDRAKKFYSEVLDLEVLSDSPMGNDMRWVQLAPRGAATTITLVTWFPSMPPGSLKGLVLETDDLEGTITRLKDEGVTPDGEIMQESWGRFVTFNDLDGNGIILRSSE